MEAVLRPEPGRSSRGPLLAAQFSPNTSKIDRPADIQEILAQVQPAVVAIRTRTLNLDDFLAPAPGQGAGTGFVISADGVIDDVVAIGNALSLKGGPTVTRGIVSAKDRRSWPTTTASSTT